MRKIIERYDYVNIGSFIKCNKCDRELQASMTDILVEYANEEGWRVDNNGDILCSACIKIIKQFKQEAQGNGGKNGEV